MLGSKLMDTVMGLDMHIEMVPMPAPVPMPFPAPFMAVLFDPMKLAAALLPGCPLLGYVGIAMDPIGSLVNWVADKLEPGVGGGPVHINGMPATNTDSDVTNRWGVPHIVIPPGTMFSKAGKPVMIGDGKLFLGSSSVWINGRRAVRALTDPVFTCSEPVRLPTLIIMPQPAGPPVMVGGAPTPDIQGIISGAVRKWVTSKIKNFVGPRIQDRLATLPNSRRRNLFSRLVCFWTGHPVDVATGRMCTFVTDWELPGPLPLVFERAYSSAVSDRDGALGFGWNHALDQSVWLERGRVVFRGGDGREIQADTMEFPGRVMRTGDEVFEHLSRNTFRRVKGGWEIEEADGTVHEFRRVEGDRVPGRWRLTKLRTRDGHAITLEYNAHGALGQVQDSGGRIIHLEHDPNGRLVRVSLPHPTKDGWVTHTKYSYSKDGNLVAVEDALGHITRYEYSGHLMVRETDPTGLSFYFGYDGIDSSAWCVRTWGDGGIYDHTIDYDKEGMRTYVTNSLGHITVYRMNEALAVVEVIDAYGGKTQHEYDEALRKTAEIDPLGNAISFEYDERGNKTKVTEPDGALLYVQYDSTNRPISAMDAVGGEWRWVYDTGGHLIEKINPIGEKQRFEYTGHLLSAFINSAGKRTGFSYDQFKNVIWVERPNGAKIRFDYDRLGRKVYSRSARGAEWRVKYDEGSRAVRVERPTGEVEQRRYDAEGNLLEVQNSLRRLRFGYTGFHNVAWREEDQTRVTFSYDTEERLRSVTNEAGEAYTFTRDALGRVVTETGFDGATQTYRYDAAGRLSQEQRPDGNQDSFKYDTAGRLTERRFGDGTFRRFHYRPDGTLLKAENEAGVVAFDRDGLGRIVKERQGEHAVVSQYGLDGLRCLMETLLGGHQTILRDVLGDVQALHLGSARAQRFVIEFERDDGVELGRQLPGGVHIEWHRDLAGRPTSRRTTHRSPTGAHETRVLKYRWAGEDQLRELVDSEAGTTMYTHDARGRLVREERPDVTLHRSMDEVGNVYRSADGRDRRYGQGGRLESADSNAYTYDANGNLIQKREHDGRIWKYYWSGSGLLREVERPDGTRIRFEYDAFARRTRKATVRVSKDGAETIESETRFVWDGNVVVHELSERPTTWYWEPETFAPVTKESDGRHWSVASDHLGTATEMYDDAGRVAWKMQLDAFGVGRKDVASQQNPWRWPGQYADEETGLRYNRFRYYDPASGNYISRDPIGLAGGLSLHGYVHDPLSWSDPLGLARVCDKVRGRLTPEQQALVDMAKADSRRILRGLGPVSAADADEYIRMANRIGVPVRAKPNDLSGAHGYGLVPPGPDASHIHINGEHVPVPPGYQPPAGSTVIQ